MSWDRGYDGGYGGSYGFRSGGGGGGGGGRGRRRNYRDDYHHHREALPESPTEKLRNTVIKYGEADPVAELSKLESSVRELTPFNSANVAETLRIALTEQPYKIPFYASLIRLLHSGEQTDATELSLGRQVLEDFFKGFQTYLDKHSWRDTRLSVHFYAHLTVSGVVSPESFATLLRTFTSVLEEPGVSFTRAKEAAFIAGEGYIIAGLSLDPSMGSEILSSIRTFSDSLSDTKWLVRPITALYDTDISETAVESLSALIATLDSLVFAETWPKTSETFPRPYEGYEPLEVSFTPYELPAFLVPPELIEEDGQPEEQKNVKKDDWPDWTLQLFPDDVSPDPSTPAGYAIRADIVDIIDIFEINRKECARILLEYPKFTAPGTFRPKPGAAQPEETEDKPNWQLESTIIETILIMLLGLPQPARKLKSVYYSGLITELAKLSPSTVGPAVGKSIRKIYALLGGGGAAGSSTEEGGLDVEASRRFAEWFAVHMSNFNFAWVWKEWIPDLQLPVTHPKRTFIRRAVELEIRLAYHDRIKKTLPEEFHDPSAEAIAVDGSSPSSEFEDPHNSHAESYKTILNLLKTRAKVEDVFSHLESLKSSLLDSAPHLTEGDIDSIARKMTIQALLSIGSRSFSHLLNAVERYLPLLRSLAGSSKDSSSTTSATESARKEHKMAILDAVIGFWWQANSQMVNIVFDKLMQYQIVDPVDIVEFVFTFTPPGAADGAGVGIEVRKWDLLEGALSKANGRVVSARNKVVALKKEEEEKKASDSAKKEGGEGDAMDVDAAKAEDPAATEPNPALATGTKALTSLLREERNALSSIVGAFVELLASPEKNSSPAQVISDAAWMDRANWTAEEWAAWESWGWWQHFCRSYSAYLKANATTLETVAFAKFEGSVDPAVLQLKKAWNVATGQKK